MYTTRQRTPAELESWKDTITYYYDDGKKPSWLFAYMTIEDQKLTLTNLQKQVVFSQPLADSTITARSAGNDGLDLRDYSWQVTAQSGASIQLQNEVYARASQLTHVRLEKYLQMMQDLNQLAGRNIFTNPEACQSNLQAMYEKYKKRSTVMTIVFLCVPFALLALIISIEVAAKR